MIKLYLIVFLSLVVRLTGLGGEVLVLYPTPYFQIDSIDLSNAPGVTLSYNQLYRWCCYESDELSVFVCNDFDPANPANAHWTEYDSRGPHAITGEYTFPEDR